MALESTSCSSLMPNKECSWTFFSSFFDERNVVELTKQTRQRIESKDLKTLCETRKLYIYFSLITFLNLCYYYFIDDTLKDLKNKSSLSTNHCASTRWKFSNSLIRVRELSFIAGLTALIVLVFVHKSCSTENNIHHCAPLPVAISRT